MPVEDNGIKEIAQFENLEMLLLNGTNLSGSNLSLLQSCIKLNRLSLANTKVKADQIDFMGKMPSLAKVFLWQTNVTPADINSGPYGWMISEYQSKTGRYENPLSFNPSASSTICRSAPPCES